MASEDMIILIVELTADMMQYMLPIIALLAGLTFIFSFLVSITMGWGKRTFGS